MEENRIVEAPMSPDALDWKRLDWTFRRQCEKSFGQQIEDFENKLCEYLGCGFSVALNSGTAALHLALKIIGVGHGDKVLCSDFTFIASANPIKYLGAEPVFIDSEPLTWNMDPELMEMAIVDLIKRGQKPKAIILVHIYGNPAQLDSIIEIARLYKIPVIEDAAQAFGSQYGGQKVGTFGDMGIFSFNNNKVFSTLGGGALVSADRTLVDRAKYLASQAKQPMEYYCHEEVGYNYAISPLNASLGYAGIPFVDEKLLKRKEIFNRFKILFEKSNHELQAESSKSDSNRWAIGVRLESESYREKVRILLEQKDIFTRRLWKPLSSQPAFEGSLAFDKGVSSGLFNCGLCLPNSSMLVTEKIAPVMLEA